MISYNLLRNLTNWTLTSMSNTDKTKTEQVQTQQTNQAWGGRFNEPVDEFVARFTASVNFDQRLYRQDIQGSIAHAKMLACRPHVTQH